MPDVWIFAPFFNALATASASASFLAIAAFAVSAFVVTVKEKPARSGTVSTLPRPETVMVFGVGVSAERAKCGCATPARAEAPKSTSTARAIFMRDVRRRGAESSRGGSGSRRLAAEVRRPALGDARRGELDEEDGLRRPGKRLQLHPELLEQAVALAEVTGSTGRDDVLPHRLSALRARHHVVERQPAVRRPAVDAAPAIAGEQRFPRDLALDRARHPDVVQQTDHM